MQLHHVAVVAPQVLYPRLTIRETSSRRNICVVGVHTSSKAAQDDAKGQN